MKKTKKVNAYQVIGWPKTIAFKDRTLKNMSDKKVFRNMKSMNKYIKLSGFIVTEVKVIKAEKTELLFNEDKFFNKIMFNFEAEAMFF